jgi:hypothetical protein
MEKEKLIEKILESEIDDFNLINMLLHIEGSITYSLSVLYTYQCATEDVEENYEFLRIISDAQEDLLEAGSSAYKALQLLSKKVPEYRGQFTESYQVPWDEMCDKALLETELRNLIAIKNRAVILTSLELNKRTARLSETDKLSVFLSDMVKSLDQFEETIYNVI